MSQPQSILDSIGRQQLVQLIAGIILETPKQGFATISAGLCIGAGNLPEAQFASLCEYLTEIGGSAEAQDQQAAALEFIRKSRRLDIAFRQRGKISFEAGAVPAETIESHHALAAAQSVGELCSEWEATEVPLPELVQSAFVRGADAKSRGTETCEAQTKAGDDLATPYEDAAAAAGLPLRTILQAAFARGIAAQTANPFQP